MYMSYGQGFHLHGNHGCILREPAEVPGGNQMHAKMFYTFIDFAVSKSPCQRYIQASLLSSAHLCSLRN